MSADCYHEPALWKQALALGLLAVVLWAVWRFDLK